MDSPEAPKKTPSSYRIALATTVGEAALLGFAGWVFSEYWLMLPVKYRFWGVAGLILGVGIWLFRVIRFWQRNAREK